jgi:hypothetical protein
MTARNTNLALMLLITGLSTLPHNLHTVDNQAIALPQATPEKKASPYLPPFVFNRGSGYDYEISLKLLREYRIFKDLYYADYQTFIKNEEKNKMIASYLLENLYEEKKRFYIHMKHVIHDKQPHLSRKKLKALKHHFDSLIKALQYIEKIKAILDHEKELPPPPQETTPPLVSKQEEMEELVTTIAQNKITLTRLQIQNALKRH